MAYVDRESIKLRAPDDGIVELKLSNTNPLVKKGDLIAVVRLVNGGVLGIESPCDCLLTEIFVKTGVFAAQGEVLFSISPPNTPIVIKAKIDFEDVSKISIGDPAMIQLLNGENMQAKVEGIIAGSVTELDITGAVPDFAVVELTTKESINIDNINSLATVYIETF
nr:HlyD family secretion protein [Pseudoalteromonas sp. C2R02]